MKPHGYKTIANLRAAAQTIDGRLAVRAAVAARLLRRVDSRLRQMAAAGQLERIALQVPRSRTEPRGLRTYYALAGLEALASRQAASRSRRPWTANELQMVQQMVGLHTVEEIACRLKRKPTAVWNAIYRLSPPRSRVDHQPEVAGGLYALVASQHRLIPAGELSRLVERDRSNIKWWIRKGCPAVRRPGRQRQYLFDLQQVRGWLADKPGILVLMSPAIRRRLRLTSEDLRQLSRESEVAA